jgi:2-polyprenyl-6-methoxyphenol hydroxylase-like FAD-dependent oxidoreductase
VCNATRAVIADHLKSECERVYGSSVTFHPDTKLIDAQIDPPRLTLKKSGGEVVSVEPDLVVAADGAGSTLRQLVAEQVLVA